MRFGMCLAWQGGGPVRGMRRGVLCAVLGGVAPEGAQGYTRPQEYRGQVQYLM